MGRMLIELRALAHDDYAHARFASRLLTADEKADAVLTQSELRKRASSAAKTDQEASHQDRVEPATPLFAAQAWRLAMMRADWRCEACGVSAPDAMEIGHRDSDHRNQRRDNLRCLCAFCHLADHPVAALRQGRATLLYAPDLDQADVSRIAWSLAWLVRELGEMYNHSSGPAGCDVGATRSTLETTLIARRDRAMRELGLDGREPGAAAALYFELARQAIIERSIGATDVALLLRQVRVAPTFMLPAVEAFDGKDARHVDRLPAMLAAASSEGGSFFGLNPAKILGDARKARDAAQSSRAADGGEDARDQAASSAAPQMSSADAASGVGLVFPPHLDEYVDEDF